MPVVALALLYFPNILQWTGIASIIREKPEHLTFCILLKAKAFRRAGSLVVWGWVGSPQRSAAQPRLAQPGISPGNAAYLGLSKEKDPKI